MRLHVLSDLHLEFGRFVLPDVSADAVVLAGDIHTGRNALSWIRAAFPNKPVIYILGNHEFYGHEIPKLTHELKELTKGTNIRVLENDQVCLGEIVFLGATLWTDFQLDGDAVLAGVAALTNVSDFQQIRMSPSGERFRPPDACRLHAQSLQWLIEQTQAARERKVVVVTHHAPSPQSIPLRYRNSPLNPAFASNLEPFIRGSEVSLWIHGHIHETADYEVGSTRILANPRGYPSERLTNFNPGLVVDV
jgi:predicted phosphohydrolase